jgi:hypothetical protein
VPAKAAAARAALAELGDKAKDLVVSLQARARDEVARRRSATADGLENLAGALRRGEPTPASGRRKAFAIAAGPGVALAVALGAGVAVGIVLSKQMKKRRQLRAAEAEAAKVETPPMPPQAIEQQVPLGAGAPH